jgi:hypothetical protein
VPNEDQIRAALTHAKRIARVADDVHGVDYGFRFVDGVRTSDMAIRFHVRRKRPSSLLSATDLLPATVGGVAVDVLEGGYQPHLGDPRTQQPALSPGISIGNLRTGETGTLGAIVRDAKGAAFILSNWHVLAGGPEAAPGDQVVQPGPMDIGQAAANPVALLDRSLSMEEQLDAALARLVDDVAVDRTIFGLDFAPSAVAEPVLGARLVKSGAVSGVTEAIVDGVSGSYEIDYSSFGLNKLWMRGCRLVKLSDSQEGSVSEPGDSGALWVDADSHAAVGLHFAGEEGASPLNDYALAHDLPEVMQRLGVVLAG